MRVGWNEAERPQPPNEAVRGVVYRDLRPGNKPLWCDITSAGPFAIDPGGRSDRHFHDCDEYWLVASGGATVEVEDVRCDIGPGDILCLRAGAAHDIVALRGGLRAFWFEGALAPGERVGSLHRDERDAAGHQVGSTDSPPLPPAPGLVVTEVAGQAGLEWSDLEGAGRFELAAGSGGERRFEDDDEYWLVCAGRALVELDAERFEVGPGDVLCIEGGRAREVIAVREPLCAFWIRRRHLGAPVGG